MTETKTEWVPKEGSLVVLYHTGCSGRVFNIEHNGGSARDDNPHVDYYVRLDSDLYPHGAGKDIEPVAKKGESVIVQYEPRYTDRDSVAILYGDGQHEMISFAPNNMDRDKWLLVRHHNDGAPKTDRFSFNHWVGWDDGKHEDYNVHFRGGHYYDYAGNAPAVDVKVHGFDLGKKIKDRQAAGDFLSEDVVKSEAEWEKFCSWVDEQLEDTTDRSNTLWEWAVEDARMNLKACLEDTGLEYEFGGRSGGWLCLTNVCDEEQWELEELTEEEEIELDRLYELSSDEMTQAEIDLEHELDERRDNALCDGDKAVVRSVLQQVEEFTIGEVGYQMLSRLAMDYDEKLEEEREEAEEEEQAEKDEAEAFNKRRELREEFLFGTMLESSGSKSKERLLAIGEILNRLDSLASSDDWDWREELTLPRFIEDKLIEVQEAWDDTYEEALMKYDHDEDCVLSRGMQVIMVNGEDRVGDPIADTEIETEPSELEYKQVREWIRKAQENEEVTGIVLQGGFDGAASRDDFALGNYEPEVATFEITLWEK